LYRGEANGSNKKIAMTPSNNVALIWKKFTMGEHDPNGI
jgi:hypothetical protein